MNQTIRIYGEDAFVRCTVRDAIKRGGPCGMFQSIFGDPLDEQRTHVDTLYHSLYLKYICICSHSSLLPYAIHRESLISKMFAEVHPVMLKDREHLHVDMWTASIDREALYSRSCWVCLVFHLMQRLYDRADDRRRWQVL